MISNNETNSTQSSDNRTADHSLSTITTNEQLQAQFSRLQALSRTQPILDWATRETQLDNLEMMLSDNQKISLKLSARTLAIVASQKPSLQNCSQALPVSVTLKRTAKVDENSARRHLSTLYACS